MSHLNRRKFIGVTAAGAAALSSLAGCRTRTGLDEGLLSSLGGAILPETLTPQGAARVVSDFTAWVSGYAAGAELNHGYGSGSLAFADGLPITSWEQQLQQLDTQARDRLARSFVDATTDERRSLVRDVLQEYPDAALGNPVRSDHIAVAILSFFYRSPEATDLAYRASIKKQQCRPLADSPSQPIALG